MAQRHRKTQRQCYGWKLGILQRIQIRSDGVGVRHKEPLQYFRCLEVEPTGRLPYRPVRDRRDFKSIREPENPACRAERLARLQERYNQDPEYRKLMGLDNEK